MYDTTYENGDVVTKEYDPKTGEVRPIGTSPSLPLPAELPSPYGLGETGVLLNVKTSSRGEGVEEFSTASSSKTTASTTPAVSTDGPETTTQKSIIDDVVNTSTLDLATSTSEILELTDFDLIVEPYIQASSTTETAIVDTATTSPAI